MYNVLCTLFNILFCSKFDQIDSFIIMRLVQLTEFNIFFFQKYKKKAQQIFVCYAKMWTVTWNSSCWLVGDAHKSPLWILCFHVWGHFYKIILVEYENCHEKRILCIQHLQTPTTLHRILANTKMFTINRLMDDAIFEKKNKYTRQRHKISK